jgi:hypothetical protein
MSMLKSVFGVHLIVIVEVESIWLLTICEASNVSGRVWSEQPV